MDHLGPDVPLHFTAFHPDCKMRDKPPTPPFAPDIRLDAARDDRARVVHVQVSDNGPGIDAALRDRVFRPFFTTKREGTGLGLALVLKIVVTHNGRVRVVDRPQGGTTMDVALPLPPAA